jgi:predicted DNA-binding transcriptional regulator
MNWHDKTLNILGLTKNEIKVLNCLNELKNVQDIARLTDLSRTGINHLIKILYRKALIKKVKSGKRVFYVAIDKKTLKKQFQEISEELDLSEKDKKGVRIKISKQDEFIIHIGVKEIVPAYQRIFSENRNERIKAIQHHKSWMELLEKVSPTQLIDFNRAIIKNHLILDGMLNESAYASYLEEIKNDPDKNKAAVESLSGRMADYAVFPDNMFNYSSEIWLFKNTALIINWAEEIAVEITNENMINFLKDMFEFVKMAGKKIDHNKIIKEVFGKV